MRKKRIFTTVLILMTFVIALFLTLGSMVKDTIEISGNQEWDRPIYNIETYSLEWPKIDTDKLSRSIVSTDGDFNQVKFENIFESEFEIMCNELPFEDYTFEYAMEDDVINVMVDSHSRYYGDDLITNPTHVYSYQLKTNE